MLGKTQGRCGPEHCAEGGQNTQRVPCFLWRSADTAAAWKERKQLTDAHTSSAVPTSWAANSKARVNAGRSPPSTTPRVRTSTLPLPLLSAAHAARMHRYPATM